MQRDAYFIANRNRQEMKPDSDFEFVAETTTDRAPRWSKWVDDHFISITTQAMDVIEQAHSARSRKVTMINVIDPNQIAGPIRPEPQPTEIDHMVIAALESLSRTPVFIDTPSHYPSNLPSPAFFSSTLTTLSNDRLHARSRPTSTPTIESKDIEGRSNDSDALQSKERRRLAWKYLDESLALSMPNSFPIIGTLHYEGPKSIPDILNFFGNSRDTFETIARLFLISAISFDDDKLMIASLGEQILRNFGLISTDKAEPEKQ